MRTSALALVIVALGAVTGVRPFSHRTHLKPQLGLKCTGCHTEGVAADVERPAKQDHSACNSKDCHAEEFFTPKMRETDLCLVCHVSKDWKELEKLRGNVRAFPRGHARSEQDVDEDRSYLDDFDFYAEFSHRQHLAKHGPIAEKSDEGCLFCHRISVESGKAVVARPGHAHCVNCHGGTESNLRKPPKNTMKDCASCHVYRRNTSGVLVKTGPEPKKKKGRVTGTFSHEKHRLDRRKSEPVPVSCATCHLEVTKADTLGEIRATSGQRMMEDACKTCHDGQQKSATGKTIFSITGKCTLCHTQRFLDSLDDEAPPSHR